MTPCEASALDSTGVKIGEPFQTSVIEYLDELTDEQVVWVGELCDVEKGRQRR